MHIDRRTKLSSFCFLPARVIWSSKVPRVFKTPRRRITRIVIKRPSCNRSRRGLGVTLRPIAEGYPPTLSSWRRLTAGRSNRYVCLATLCRHADVMPKRHADETGNSAMSWWHIRRRRGAHRVGGKSNFSQRARPRYDPSGAMHNMKCANVMLTPRRPKPSQVPGPIITVSATALIGFLNVIAMLVKIS